MNEENHGATAVVLARNSEGGGECQCCKKTKHVLLAVRRL